MTKCQGGYLFMNSPCKFLLLYHKNTENLNLFYENPAEINVYQTLDIILADFNINGLEADSQILQVLSNYVQVVRECTQISGGVLSLYRRKYCKKVL